VSAKKPEVEMVHFGARIAYLSNNVIVPIVKWLDPWGEACEREQAVVCVAGDPQQGWFTIVMAEFEPPTVH